ncbi:MAG: cytochrome c3 family protein [Candidatus Binataceae bacterium]
MRGLLFGIVPLSLLLTAAAIAVFSQRPWQARTYVVQPIPFSHRVHAGEHHIPCLYCHAYARRSDFAGVPPIQRCVGCHGSLNWREVKPVRKPWTDHANAPYEVRWHRVYVLPNFVRFSHRIHIHAHIRCQKCHGAVQTMDRIKPKTDLNMGFCIGCHYRMHVTRDCFVCHY